MDEERYDIDLKVSKNEKEVSCGKKKCIFDFVLSYRLQCPHGTMIITINTALMWLNSYNCHNNAAVVFESKTD